MIDRKARYVRPALWGFFICMAVAGILLLVRLFIPSLFFHNWSSELSARHAKTEQFIRKTIQNRVDGLASLAKQVMTDTVMTQNIKLNDTHAVRKVFRSLNSYGVRNGQTLDLIDERGNLIAWNGQSITTAYEKLIDEKLAEQFVRVTQDGLRIYLTVGSKIANNPFYLLISEPLEVNSPISNRFVQKVSICEILSQTLRTKVVLRIPQTYTPHQGEYCVPVLDREGKTIAEFFVADRSLENETVYYIDAATMMIILLLACGGLFIAYAATMWISRKDRNWINIFAGIISLWFVRLLWRELNFPANIIGGWLFNPDLYASTFPLGLASSLGELSITMLAVIVSFWLIARWSLLDKRVESLFPKIGIRIGRLGSLALVTILIMLSLWLFRGFSEAIRSFVFDSTVKYENPSEIFLETAAVIIEIDIILLGISLLCASIIIFWASVKILSGPFISTRKHRRLIFGTIIILSTLLFLWIDGTPSVPIFSLLIFILFNIAFVEFFIKWDRDAVDPHMQKRRMLVWFFAGSFFIGIPILHIKLEQKQHKEIEVAAYEYSRPSNSWLAFIVQDGLRVSADDLLKEFYLGPIANIKENHLSFTLWTKTLLGKEGYNSALIIYDDQGNEVDRFVVGMRKSEQQEILTQTFTGEEEVVQVIDRSAQRTYGKLYGAWKTVVDSSGQLAGSIALLLSENQKAIFRKEETEPLRQFSDQLENETAREIAVHEYLGDTLIFSSGLKLYPDRLIPASIKNDLQISAKDILWKTIRINRYSTQTVFLKNASSHDRIIAISLEEPDFRWGLFAYLKELFIPIALLIAAAIFLLIRKSSRSGLPALGFSSKLLIGFSCITLLPLVILSYYNKQLASQRMQEQIKTTLYRELDQLQDRISAYVADEEDFVYGADDDFCEALAAEYGVDFSIYRDASIQASSRAELYRASFLDRRLNGRAYRSIMLDGKNNVLISENIGSVEYVVGYAPLSIAGKISGVIAIPTLSREKEIEIELAQRNVDIFGIYAIVFGLALIGGGLLAYRFARPLNQLTAAAKDVADGNLDVNVKADSRDEIGVLAESFNEMVSKLRTSRIELAKHERESAWKEMAKQVAHEIRNPLTPIKLSIQHLRQAFKDKAPEREDILQRVTQTIIEQIETLSRIASEFSSFAKMPERKFGRFDINVLLKENVNLFSEVIGIVFVERFALSPVMIVADRDQLSGVFINIIRNAIQAFDRSGTITVETVLEGKQCKIRITDTGSGISEEIRSKIFEPNFSTKTEGMGLGLAIARRVIEDHGGTIFCQSERGKGTTFEIHLPV